jgi:ankyrin repeat protein
MSRQGRWFWALAAAGVMAAGQAEGARDLPGAAKDEELFAAIQQGSFADMRAAFSHGASPKAVNKAGSPALVEAVLYCDEEAVKLLLDRGADPNAHAQGGSPALVLAAGDYAKVRALVEKGAQVNARSPMGRTALLAAAAQRDSYRIVSYLLEHGADPKALDGAPEFLSNGTNANALMYAARSGDLRTMTLLLDQGLDVNAATTSGNTALCDAISARNEEAVRLLIERGAKVNFAFGPTNQTPLIWASFQEASAIVEDLLVAGADVNAKDKLGSTALVWAAMSERDDTRTVSALLHAGASVDVRTAMGETPLSWAKRRGATGIVALIESEMNREGEREGEKDANQ